MPEPSSTSPPMQGESQARLSAVAGAGSRVDAAHTQRAPEESAPAENVSGQPSAESLEQVRIQAGQLAAHLRHKQKELDRREAQLHAQYAAADHAERASKLWSKELSQEIQEAQQKLEEQARDLELREKSLSAMELSLDGESAQQTQQLTDLQRRLEARSRSLQERERRVKEQEEQHRRANDSLLKKRDKNEKWIALSEQKIEAKQLDQENQMRALLRNVEERRNALDEEESRIKQLNERPSERQIQIENRLKERAEELETQGRRIEDVEFLFDQQWADLMKQRQLLEDDKQDLEAKVQAERKHIAEEQHAREMALNKQREEMMQQSGLLEQRQAAIERMHQEVNQGQRETLEMRLAIEELWASLAGRNQPAALAKSINQIRAKLAAHYSHQSDALEIKSENIQKQVEELAAKTAALQEHRQAMQQWAERQSKEIEIQAARLVAREQELDLEAKKMRRREAKWEDQRRELQKEIRQLHRCLRVPEKEAAL